MAIWSSKSSTLPHPLTWVRPSLANIVGASFFNGLRVRRLGGTQLLLTNTLASEPGGLGFLDGICSSRNNLFRRERRTAIGLLTGFVALSDHPHLGSPPDRVPELPPCERSKDTTVFTGG